MGYVTVENTPPYNSKKPIWPLQVLARAIGEWGGTDNWGDILWWEDIKLSSHISDVRPSIRLVFCRCFFFDNVSSSPMSLPLVTNSLIIISASYTVIIHISKANPENPGLLAMERGPMWCIDLRIRYNHPPQLHFGVEPSILSWSDANPSTRKDQPCLPRLARILWQRDSASWPVSSSLLGNSLQSSHQRAWK